MKSLRLCLLMGALTVLTTNCSEFALIAAGGSAAATQNAYVKAYNGLDVLTIVYTDKDIKKHVYEQLRNTKKVTEYIRPSGLFSK
jgi:hypothetical protein